MTTLPNTGPLKFTDFNTVRGSSVNAKRALTNMWGFSTGVPTYGQSISMSQLRGKALTAGNSIDDTYMARNMTITGLGVNPLGNLFVTGSISTQSTATQIYGANGTSLAIVPIAVQRFVAKYDADDQVSWLAGIVDTGSQDMEVKPASDGGIYVVGDYRSATRTTTFYGAGSTTPDAVTLTVTNSGSSDWYICKYNDSGLIQYVNALRGTGDQYFNEIETSGFDGGYLACGGYSSSYAFNFRNATGTTATIALSTQDTTYGKGFGSGFVTKFTAAGQYSWVARLICGQSAGMRCITEGIDGSVYVFANCGSVSFNSGITYFISADGTDEPAGRLGGTYGVFFIKLNRFGKLLWMQHTGGDAVNDRYDKICFTREGKFVGAVLSTNTTSPRVSMFTEYASSMAVAWTASFSPGGNGSHYSMIPSNDGGIYFARNCSGTGPISFTNANATIYATLPAPAASWGGSVIAKLTSTGQYEWALFHYNGTVKEMAVGRSGLYVGGYYNSTDNRIINAANLQISPIQGTTSDSFLYKVPFTPLPDPTFKYSFRSQNTTGPMVVTLPSGSNLMHTFYVLVVYNNYTATEPTAPTGFGIVQFGGNSTAGYTYALFKGKTGSNISFADTLGGCVACCVAVDRMTVDRVTNISVHDQSATAGTTTYAYTKNSFEDVLVMGCADGPTTTSYNFQTPLYSGFSSSQVFGSTQGAVAGRAAFVGVVTDTSTSGNITSPALSTTGARVIVVRIALSLKQI